MHHTSPSRRRPSAALVVAFVALFAALGGVGWAATQLPANSVGTRQLRNNAVTYQKIALHTIGAQRIDQNVVQVRVGGTCSGTKGAIGSIARSGGVSCNSTVPNEFGASGPAVTIKTASTTVTTKSLPSGSNYLVLANPSIAATGAASQVTVGCTLSVGSTNQFRNITFPAATGTQLGVIPLQLASGSGTATVACSTDAPSSTTVTGPSGLNAIQTGTNG